MGLVSAVVAGFEVTALVEVNVCGQGEDHPCSGSEEGFIFFASLVIGLSTFVIVEAALEYGFVMRELHYGHRAAWALLVRLQKFRKMAEVAFVCNLLCFLLATSFMLHVRFAETQAKGAYIGITIMGVSLAMTMVTVFGMQYEKYLHVRKHEGRERDEDRYGSPLSDSGSPAQPRASVLEMGGRSRAATQHRRQSVVGAKIFDLGRRRDTERDSRAPRSAWAKLREHCAESVRSQQSQSEKTEGGPSTKLPSTKLPSGKTPSTPRGPRGPSDAERAEIRLQTLAVASQV